MPTNTFMTPNHQDCILATDDPYDYKDIDYCGRMDGIKIFIGNFHSGFFQSILEKVSNDKSNMFIMGEVWLAQDLLSQLNRI